MEEVHDANGFVFSVACNADVKKKFFIPEEILTLILSYVNVEDLILKCRLVCRSWNWIIQNVALRNKAERERAANLKKEGKKKCILPWYIYYWICKKNIFGRNLLNSKDECEHWEMESNEGDLQKYKKAFPQYFDFESKTCFHLLNASSRSDKKCKAQLIELSNEGVIPKIMDEYQPIIRIREWFCCMSISDCIYELKISLLNEKKSPVTDFVHIEKLSRWESCSWKLVEHQFSNYGPGVRYIIFGHQIKHFLNGSYEIVGVRLNCSLRIETT